MRGLKKNSLEIQKLKKKARRLSIGEGIFASAKTSFGFNYISPFAIAINASNSLVAILTSITGLIDPLSQIFGSKLMERYPRKKIVLKSVFIEALMWIPFIAIALCYYLGYLIPMLPFLLLFSFGFYSVFTGLGHPAWFSWMGDIVDDKKRGRWFSKRNLLVGFTSVVLAISAAFFLDYMKKKGFVMFGFIVLFLLALTSRLLSWRTFKKSYEPEIKLKDGDYFSFFDFLIKAPKNNFGRFSLFRFLFTLTTSISSPLLAIYLLRNLGFSYSAYMIITFIGTGFSLFAFEILGKFADRYGNYKTLCISSGLIVTVPILWILHSSPIYLALIPSTISGIAWAGVHLAEQNFIYDNVKPQKRGLAVSYYNMLWGLGVFIGAGIAAFLVKFVSVSFMDPIKFIFIIGFVARLISVVLPLHLIKEIKNTKKFRGSQALREIIFKQAIPTIHEEVKDIIHIKKYLFTKK